MAKHWLIRKTLQTYWRLTRGLTIGAQGLVIDGTDRVLLVRHGYRPGWHFPGGGVEKNEAVESALQRELSEEVGVSLLAQPQLFGIYDNSRLFPGDHIVLYVCRVFEQPNPPGPHHEIAEHGFYARDRLPAGTVEPVRRRLAEVFGETGRSVTW